MFRQHLIWNRVTARQRIIALIITLIFYIGAMLFVLSSLQEFQDLDFLLLFFIAGILFILLLFFTVFQQQFREGHLRWQQDSDFWHLSIFCIGFVFTVTMFLLVNRLIAPLTTLGIMLLCGIMGLVSYIFLLLSWKQK